MARKGKEPKGERVRRHFDKVKRRRKYQPIHKNPKPMKEV